MKREMIYFERPVALGMNFFGGWDKLAEKIRAGESGLEVGDIFPITLKSGQEIELVVVGVDIYNKGEVIFSFKDTFKQILLLGIEPTLGLAFCLLPDELTKVIKPRNGENLWLFSRAEVFGTRNKEALPYYQRWKNRIKFMANSPTNWWLRDSLTSWSNESFVSAAGYCMRSDDSTPNCLGVVPGFMI